MRNKYYKNFEIKNATVAALKMNNDRGVSLTGLLIVDEKLANSMGYNAYGDHRDLEDFVNAMIDDGWTVKWFEATENAPVPNAYLPVQALYGRNQDKWPEIGIIRGKKVTVCDSVTVEDVVTERSHIKKLDVYVELQPWSYQNKSGEKARIVEMAVVMDDDKPSLLDAYRDYDIDEPMPFDM